jgi:hypothetical protein
MVIVGLVFISSCKDDEKPKADISFAVAEEEANESDGTIEVRLNIGRALSETVVLAYTLGGTATEEDDYEISPVGGYITIAAGATEAIVELDLLEDADLEYDFDQEIGFETIEITLTSVVSGPANLEGQLVYTLSVFEDDLLVYISWPEGTGDIDIDVLAYVDDPEDNPDQGLLQLNPNIVGGQSGSNEFDFAFIYGSFPEAEYGFAYPYYSGTADDVDFTVELLNFGGTLNGAATSLTFEGNYALDNINKYDEVGAPAPHIAQTAEKQGLNFVNVSDLTLLDVGSRIKTLTGEVTFKKTGESNKIVLSPEKIKQLKKFLKKQ